MSGIAGIMTADGQEAPEDKLLELNSYLDHRGTVDSGIATKNNVGLIYRSSKWSTHGLVNEGSYQPLSSPTNLSVVCDGYFSNQSKLHSEYADKYRFESPCASELLFPLYEAYGAEFSESLKGAFAFAFYDGHAEDLILSCDPSGLKPLYYMWYKDLFVFSSSLRSLHRYRENSRLNARHHSAKKAQETPSAVDMADLSNLDDEDSTLFETQALKETLQYGNSVTAQTIFSDIHRVLPGETLIIHKAKITKRFSKSLRQELKPSKLSSSEAKKSLLSAVESKLMARLSSIGKSGLCLSGAGDYILHGVLQNTIHPNFETVLIDVAEVKLQSAEIKSALQIDKAKTIHKAQLDESAFWRQLPFLVEACDEPVLNPNYIFEFMGSKALSKTTNSVITGFDAGFMMADHPRFKTAKRLPLFGGRLTPKNGAFHGLADMPVFLGQWSKNLKAIEAEISAHSKGTRVQKSQLIQFESQLGLTASKTIDSIFMAQSQDVHFILNEFETLRDVLSMPDAVKIHHGQTGYILAESLQALYPVEQYGSLNFRAYFDDRSQVLDSWLTHKSSRLGALVAHQPEIEALFSQDFIRTIFSCKTKKHINCAWILLLFSMWHQSKVIGVAAVADTLTFLSSK